MTTTADDDSSSSKNAAFKTWNFDGFVIESTTRPKASNRARRIQEEPAIVPDISSPSIDDLDLQLSRLEAKNRQHDEDLASICGSDTSFFSEISSASKVQKMGAVKKNMAYPWESTPVIQKEQQVDMPKVPIIETETEDDEAAGAAGLWAKSEGLPCFKTASDNFRAPHIEKAQVQQSRAPFEPKPILYPELYDQPTDALVPNANEDRCQMCKRELARRQGIVLKDCLHPFCRRCLTHAIENNETATMSCPSLTVKCEGEVRDEEIKALLTPEAYEKYTLQQLVRLDVFDLAEVHENYDYVETKRGFKCNICLEEIPAGDGLTLKSCVHDFCKKCLIAYIERAETSLIKCPFVNEDNEQCVGFLYDSEIRSFVSGDVYRKHLDKSLADCEADPSAYHCKTPNCKYFVFLDDEFVEEFDCEICKTKNCVKCKTVHNGISCEDNQARLRNNIDYVRTEAQVRNELATRRIQPCPRCGIAVIRTEGCPNMRCTRCNENFVWRQ